MTRLRWGGIVALRGATPMTIEQPQDVHQPESTTNRAESRVRRALLGAYYSPWTERARWSLDHHGIAYRFEEHVPVMGELALRRRLGAYRGARATVPVFFDGPNVISESIDIVFHADSIGRGAPLVRDREATRRYFERVERGLVAMRGRVLASVLTDREAQRESAVMVPKSVAGLMRPFVRASTRFMASKYGVSGRSAGDFEPEMRELLVEIRRAIDDGSLSTDTFSANHIAAATFLQGVSPVRAPHMQLTQAVRRAWTCEPLAAEFADVLSWRDLLYSQRRFRIPDSRR